jgi:hypothetical protein
MRWLSLFLACQHFNSVTNLRDCENQGWLKLCSRATGWRLLLYILYRYWQRSVVRLTEVRPTSREAVQISRKLYTVTRIEEGTECHTKGLSNLFVPVPLLPCDCVGGATWDMSLTHPLAVPPCFLAWNRFWERTELPNAVFKNFMPDCRFRANAFGKIVSSRKITLNIGFFLVTF